MEISFHLGAHATDDGAVLKVLRQNHQTLADQAIAVPAPDLYPGLLRMAARGFAGTPVPDAQARAALLAELAPQSGGRPAPERLVLSFESYLGFAQDAVGPDSFYPAAARRVAVLGEIFEGHPLHLSLAVRNPATLLPALSARRSARDLPPLELAASQVPHWSKLIAALQSSLPQARLTLWCDEDAPILWHSLLRHIAGFDEATELSAVLDYPAGLLPTDSAAGRRLRAWFERNRPDQDHLRAAALREWLTREAAGIGAVPAGLPGWSPAEVAAVTAAYDADCAQIARMPGVRFLVPEAGPDTGPDEAPDAG